MKFLDWWVTQLAALIPLRYRRGRNEGGNALIINLSENWDAVSSPTVAGLNLVRRRNGQDVQLGRLALGADVTRHRRPDPHRRDQLEQVRLRVPFRLLLERDVVLPLAAQRELNNVLRYEIDSITPFSAAQLFWSASAPRRDPLRGKISLRLSMVPQSKIAPIIADLAAANLPVAALEVLVPGAGGGMRVISLAGGAPAQRHRRGPRVLAGVCAALAIIAVTLPFVLQSRRATALDRDMRRLAPRVAQAEALRQQLASAARTQDVIVAAAAQVGNPLAAIAAVTQALPNTSFLSQLSLNHRQLNIAGQSASAAALLAALSTYPILTDVAFTAPVTRDAAAQKDMFSIQITVAPQ